MDKEKVIIRSVRESDIAELNAIRTHDAVVKNINSNPSESTRYTERYFLEGGKDVFAVVAADSHDKVVGYARLAIDTEPRKRHMAHLSMAVSASQHGCGVGKILLDSAIELASSWLKLSKLSLQVVAENENAIKLYSSRGFEVEGTLKKNFIVDGVFVDAFIMAKFL